MEKSILQQASINSQKKRESLSFKGLNTFPEPVQRYLRYAIKEGSEPIYYAKLIHGGEFRTNPKQPWFPIKGYYHYLANPPTFFWKGRIKPLPILSISARDYYYKGKGEVRIRLNRIIPMGKFSGSETDEASLMRFISEMPIFPTVFLTNDSITWEEIDSNSAHIQIEDCGVKIGGIFYFNNKGEITKFVSERARIVKSSIFMDKWTGHFQNYKEFGGMKIPSYFIAEWNLREGDFQYAKFSVESIEFNNPQ